MGYIHQGTQKVIHKRGTVEESDKIYEEEKKVEPNNNLIMSRNSFLIEQVLSSTNLGHCIHYTYTMAK